jgi:hypothetical protein
VSGVPRHRAAHGRYLRKGMREGEGGPARRQRRDLLRKIVTLPQIPDACFGALELVFGQERLRSAPICLPDQSDIPNWAMSPAGVWPRPRAHRPSASHNKLCGSASYNAVSPSADPRAHCAVRDFSVGCVLFQVFATEQKDADLSPDHEAWLAQTDPYQAALLPIAPSSTPHRWPPRAVFTAVDRGSTGRRLHRGLPARP